MTEQAWTQEPWIVGDRAEPFDPELYRGYSWPLLGDQRPAEFGDDLPVAPGATEFTVIMLGNNERPEDLHRAAACVNALSGIADPEAWVAAVREAVGFLRYIGKHSVRRREAVEGIQNKARTALRAVERAERGGPAS